MRAEQIVAGVERQKARAEVRRGVALLGKAPVVLAAAMASHAGAGHELFAAAIEVDRRNQRTVGREGEELGERPVAVDARQGRPFHRHAGNAFFIGQPGVQHGIDLTLAGTSFGSGVVADVERDVVRPRLRGHHAAHQVQVHLVDVVGRHLGVGGPVGLEQVLAFPVVKRDRLDHAALRVAFFHRPQGAVVHAGAEPRVLAFIGEELPGTWQAVRHHARLRHDHAPAHVAVGSVGHHLHHARAAVRHLVPQLDRLAADVAGRVDGRRHIERLAVRLALHLQLEAGLDRYRSIDRVVAESVHPHRRRQRLAIGLQHLHGGCALQVEELVLRAANAAIGGADVAEQAQVARSTEHRHHGVHAGLKAGREAAAVGQRQVSRGGAFDGVALATLQHRQAYIAVQVGQAAKHSLAAGLLDHLHRHVGQVDQARRGRAAAGRCELGVVARYEAHAPAAARGVGRQGCRVTQRLAHRCGGAQGVGGDRVLLLHVAAPAVGHGDVGEVKPGAVRHRPHRRARIAVLDAAGGDAPLVLKRVAVGVSRFDAEGGLVDAAVCFRAGAAPAACQCKAQTNDRCVRDEAFVTPAIARVHAEPTLS